eukprot:94431_1
MGPFLFLQSLIFLPICIYLSHATTFTKSYYLSSISSFNETWNSIYNNIYNGTFNITYHNNTLLMDNYIFNLTIISNLTIDTFTYIDLPNFDHINRITININCMQESDLCPVFITNYASFIVAYPQNSLIPTHITLTLSNIHFTIVEGQASILQIYDNNIIDIIEFNNIIFDCHYYCYMPIYIKYYSNVYYQIYTYNHIFVLNNIEFNNIASPIYMLDAGHIDLYNIFVDNSITDDVLHFESIYRYNMSDIFIYNSNASSLIYVSTPQYVSPINILSNSIFTNNTVYHSVIQIVHGWTAQTTDIYNNLHISYIYNALYGIIDFRGHSSSLYLTNINIEYTYDSYWSIILYIVNNVYIDSCNISNTNHIVGAIGIDSKYIEILNTIIQYNYGFGIVYFSDWYEDTIIENTLIQYNTYAAIQTGGIHSMNISNSILRGNQAASNTAGAFYVSIELLIINNCLFELNNGFRSGGAITHQWGRMLIYNSQFINNKAYHGGAIFMFHYSDSEMYGIEIYDTEFINNTAHDGGAFRVDRNVYYLQNVSFINNTALAAGGAINDVMAIEGCTIINNINRNTSNYQYVVHIGQDTIFKNNKARLGGAIYSTNCNMHINGAKFVNNTGITSGGAILFDVSTSNISVFNTEFNYNFAGQSGGGAVTITGGNIIFNQCIFNTNCAHTMNSIGGAILLQVINGFVDDKTSTYVVNCLFNNNYASSGGAIAVQTLGVNELNMINYNEIVSYLLNIENVTMNNNKALINCGGGIYLNYGSIKFINNKIINNKAIKCG